MPINILDGFNLTLNKPIDYRIVASNSTVRNAIATYSRYDGLKVFQLDDRKEYTWNEGSSTWDTPVTYGNITGTGSIGYVPYFSSSNNIATSSIYVTGSNIGIRTTDPKSHLQLNTSIVGSSGMPPLSISNTTVTTLSTNYYNDGSDKSFTQSKGGVRVEFGTNGTFAVKNRKPSDPDSTFSSNFYINRYGQVGVYTNNVDNTNSRGGYFNIGKGTMDSLADFQSTDKPYIYIKGGISDPSPNIMMTSGDSTKDYRFGLDTSNNFFFTTFYDNESMPSSYGTYIFKYASYDTLSSSEGITILKLDKLRSYFYTDRVIINPTTGYLGIDAGVSTTQGYLQLGTSSTTTTPLVVGRGASSSKVIGSNWYYTTSDQRFTSTLGSSQVMFSPDGSLEFKNRQPNAGATTYTTSMFMTSGGTVSIGSSSIIDNTYKLSINGGIKMGNETNPTNTSHQPSIFISSDTSVVKRPYILFSGKNTTGDPAKGGVGISSDKYFTLGISSTQSGFVLRANSNYNNGILERTNDNGIDPKNNEIFKVVPTTSFGNNGYYDVYLTTPTYNISGDPYYGKLVLGSGVDDQVNTSVPIFMGRADSSVYSVDQYIQSFPSTPPNKLYIEGNILFQGSTTRKIKVDDKYSNGNGSGITIEAGNAYSSSGTGTFDGGNITITAGRGAGNSVSSNGGHVTITGGAASLNSTTPTAGNVYIQGGFATSSTSIGNVFLAHDRGSVTMGSTSVYSTYKLSITGGLRLGGESTTPTYQPALIVSSDADSVKKPYVLFTGVYNSITPSGAAIGLSDDDYLTLGVEGNVSGIKIRTGGNYHYGLVNATSSSYDAVTIGNLQNGKIEINTLSDVGVHINGSNIYPLSFTVSAHGGPIGAKGGYVDQNNYGSAPVLKSWRSSGSNIFTDNYTIGGDQDSWLLIKVNGVTKAIPLWNMDFVSGV